MVDTRSAEGMAHGKARNGRQEVPVVAEVPDTHSRSVGDAWEVLEEVQRYARPVTEEVDLTAETEDHSELPMTQLTQTVEVVERIAVLEEIAGLNAVVQEGQKRTWAVPLRLPRHSASSSDTSGISMRQIEQPRHRYPIVIDSAAQMKQQVERQSSGDRQSR